MTRKNTKMVDAVASGEQMVSWHNNLATQDAHSWQHDYLRARAWLNLVYGTGRHGMAVPFGRRAGAGLKWLTNTFAITEVHSHHAAHVCPVERA
jgi:hypothetical protein